MRVALKRAIVTKGQSDLCQKEEEHFFSLLWIWQWAKEPSLLLALPAECGSAWDVPRALDCRWLGGLLGCSRQAQHGMELHVPFQARECSGIGWVSERGLLVGVDKCTAVGAVCFQNTLLGFPSACLGIIPSVSVLQSLPRALILCHWTPERVAINFGPPEAGRQDT